MEYLITLFSFIIVFFLFGILPGLLKPELRDFKSSLLFFIPVAIICVYASISTQKRSEARRLSDYLYDSFISYSVVAEEKLDSFADKSDYIAFIHLDSDIYGDKYSDDGELIGSYTYDHSLLHVRFFDKFDDLSTAEQNSIVKSTSYSVLAICNAARSECGYSNDAKENNIEYRFNVTLDTNTDYFGTYYLEDGKLVKDGL